MSEYKEISQTYESQDVDQDSETQMDKELDYHYDLRKSHTENFNALERSLEIDGFVNQIDLDIDDDVTDPNYILSDESVSVVSENPSSPVIEVSQKYSERHARNRERAKRKVEKRKLMILQKHFKIKNIKLPSPLQKNLTIEKVMFGSVFHIRRIQMVLKIRLLQYVVNVTLK